MTFALVGMLCLGLSGLLLYKLLPRKGQPASGWIGTDTGETTVALLQFALFVFGIALLVKGILLAQG